jgi:hypothetical protein
MPRTRKRYMHAVAVGECVDCSSLAARDYVLCERCLARARVGNAKRYLRRWQDRYAVLTADFMAAGLSRRRAEARARLALRTSTQRLAKARGLLAVQAMRDGAA